MDVRWIHEDTKDAINKEVSRLGAGPFSVIGPKIVADARETQRKNCKQVKIVAPEMRIALTFATSDPTFKIILQN